MVEIAERTTHVTGLPAERGGAGDPSPFTAAGVQAAMRACARARFGTRDSRGAACAWSASATSAPPRARLADAGCELIVADIDPAKRALADALGADDGSSRRTR